MPFNYYNKICKHLKNGSEYLLFLGNGWNNVRTGYKNLISLLVRDGSSAHCSERGFYTGQLCWVEPLDLSSPQFLWPVLASRSLRNLLCLKQPPKAWAFGLNQPLPWLDSASKKTWSVNPQLSKTEEALQLHTDLHQAKQHASDEHKSWWQGDLGLNSVTHSVTMGLHTIIHLSLQFLYEYKVDNSSLIGLVWRFNEANYAKLSNTNVWDVISPQSSSWFYTHKNRNKLNPGHNNMNCTILENIHYICSLNGV